MHCVDKGVEKETLPNLVGVVIHTLSLEGNWAMSIKALSLTGKALLYVLKAMCVYIYQYSLQQQKIGQK